MFQKGDARSSRVLHTDSSHLRPRASHAVPTELSVTKIASVAFERLSCAHFPDRFVTFFIDFFALTLDAKPGFAAFMAFLTGATIFAFAAAIASITASTFD